MRVLIVEDEIVIAMAIEAIVMDRIPAAQVVTAASVYDGLRAAREQVGFAFLDIDVTDGKTYPLAMELRLRNIPFVFVSGTKHDNPPEELAGSGFIRKPFSSGDILHALDDMAPDAGAAGGLGAV
jgi:DNA-binding LytR/AlgR family response regulator